MVSYFSPGELQSRIFESPRMPRAPRKEDKPLFLQDSPLGALGGFIRFYDFAILLIPFPKGPCAQPHTLYT